MKKIDIHTHASKRFLKNSAIQNATIENLQERMNIHNIERSVVLAAYFPQKGTGVSNYQMLDWTKDAPNIDVFGSLDFEHYFYQGLNELEELGMAGRIKGIKVYTCYQSVDLTLDKADKLAELASSYNLPIMFHVGHSHGSMRKHGRHAYANLITSDDISEFAQKHSNLDLIIAHMGKPFFEKTINAVKNNPRVYADMSGLIDSVRNREDIPRCVQAIRTFVSECGSKRLLFGSDFPVQTQEDSIYFIEEGMKNFSQKDRENVYYNNAARLLQ